MEIGTRQEVAKKIGRFLKTAQKEEAIVPEISDEGIPDLPEPGELEDLDDLEALEEDVEELGEDVEEEGKEEQEVLEELRDDVKEIGETLETVVDALEDQKEVVEIALGEETDTEEKFEEFKEEEGELEDEEFTPEEFGIETEGTEEKEEGMKTGSLREKRNARLKKIKKEASTTLSEEFNEPATSKKKFSPQAPAPTITKMKKDDIPEMLKLADLSLEHNEKKPAWVVMSAEDQPLFEIPIGKIDEKEFNSKEFAEMIIQEMSKSGIAKTLKKYKATVIKKADEKPAEGEEQSDQEPVADEEIYKRAVADVRRRFIRAFKLATTAMNKNLIKPVPLKKELFEIMSNLEIDEPQKIIDYAFDRGHIAHMEKAIAQAEKFMDMKDDSLVEAESMIMEVETVTPETEVDGEIERKTASLSRAAALSRRASKSSLLLSTSTDAHADDKLSALRGVLPKPANWRVKFGAS